jgi:hypothetical protein
MPISDYANTKREATDLEPSQLLRQVGNITLNGASGSAYDFAVYPLEMELNTWVGGIIGITSRFSTDDGYQHKIVFLDEVTKLPAFVQEHPRKACFLQHGGDCVAVHVETDEERRLAKFKDLRKVLRPICNRDGD